MTSRDRQAADARSSRCAKRRSVTPDELSGSLTSDLSTWSTAPGFFTVDQLTADGLRLILQKARSMRFSSAKRADGEGAEKVLERYILSTVSYEPSPETDESFETAFRNLGGGILHVDGGKGGNTSAKKGESLADTLSCMECYSDVTVLRHPDLESVQEAMRRADKPLVLAGGSALEHPTQALRDVFTIFEALGLLSDAADGGVPAGDKAEERPIVVVLAGDLQNRRSGHEFVKLLARSGKGVTLRYCCASPQLAMPQEVSAYLGLYDNIKEEFCEKLEQAVIGADVLYDLGLANESSLKVPSGMVFISSNPMDFDTRQVDNGVYVRMALFMLIFGKA